MRTVVVLSCCIFALACGMSRQEQLEAVAKDWCMTIRASQIIPVYPLTEDVHPGDIFLVQTTIDRQQEIYAQRGFLPLDNHLARIRPSGYASFYGRSFLADAEDPMLPVDWIRPDAAEDGTAADEWGLAPNAAFPTYSFAVDQGAGLNLAVPISGIPVGLSLLGTQTANGSVSIDRARTMGVDTLSLYRDVKQWALLHRAFLSAYAPEKDETPRNYLRVLTRVYATGKLDVVLSDARAFSGGLDAGVPRPVELLTAAPPAKDKDVGASSIENYTANLAALNKMLAGSPVPEKKATPDPSAAEAAVQAVAGAAPGGSLRVTAASSRYIALQQDFDPPLVIGYLGFDVAILEGGEIGPPIPTHARIDPKSQGEPFTATSVVRVMFSEGLEVPQYNVLVAAAEDDERAAEAVARLDSLIRFVPDSVSVLMKKSNGSIGEKQISIELRDYRGFLTYLGILKVNVGLLSRELGAEGPEPADASRLRRQAAGWAEWLDRTDVQAEHRAAALFAGEALIRHLQLDGDEGR